MIGAGARIVLVGSLLILTACGQPGRSAASTSATGSPGEQAVSSGQPSLAVATNQRCATEQLAVTPGGSHQATGNALLSFGLVNRSGSTCFLGGYPGVEMVDGQGHPLQDATRDTNSFFGAYAGPHLVEIKPGTSSSFDITYGAIDPCANGAPAQYAASLKITPPGDYSSASLNFQLGPVCPNTLVVHPVGSTPAHN